MPAAGHDNLRLQGLALASGRFRELPLQMIGTGTTTQTHSTCRYVRPMDQVQDRHLALHSVGDLCAMLASAHASCTGNIRYVRRPRRCFNVCGVCRPLNILLQSIDPCTSMTCASKPEFPDAPDILAGCIMPTDLAVHPVQVPV